MEIGNFEDLVLFENWSLKLKIGIYTPNSCPKTWGAIVGSGNCLVVFHNLFSPFQSLFKLPKISIKFRCTLALSESDLEDLVSERHSKETKEVTNWSVSTFKG